MKNTIYNDIQSLFKSGEIQTIKFAKNGKVMVKFRTEPRAVAYYKGETVIQTIIEDAKLRESLEVVKIVKPKLTMTVKGAERLNKAFKESNLACLSLSNALHKADSRSYFEKFYDYMSDIIGGGKSFAPNELKTFA